MDHNPDENQQSKRVVRQLSSFQTNERKGVETRVYYTFKDPAKETDSKTDAANSKICPCATPSSVSS